MPFSYEVPTFGCFGVSSEVCPAEVCECCINIIVYIAVNKAVYSKKT
jgi:hypothetical protein